MEKEKKGIRCSYAVLVIISFAALAFVVDYSVIERKMGKCDCPDCSATSNNIISDNSEGGAENNAVTEENVTLENIQFIRNTELHIDQYQEGYYDIKIVDGNIRITNGEKTIEYTGYKAKSLYSKGFMDYASVNLFFLTEDGSLYKTNYLYQLFEKVQYRTPIKLGDNIKEIVSSDEINDGFANYYYIKTLSNDNKFVNYYWRTFAGPYTDDEIGAFIKEY